MDSPGLSVANAANSLSLARSSLTSFNFHVARAGEKPEPELGGPKIGFVDLAAAGRRLASCAVPSWRSSAPSTQPGAFEGPASERKPRSEEEFARAQIIRSEGSKR